MLFIYFMINVNVTITLFTEEKKKGGMFTTLLYIVIDILASLIKPMSFVFGRGEIGGDSFLFSLSLSLSHFTLYSFFKNNNY